VEPNKPYLSHVVVVHFDRRSSRKLILHQPKPVCTVIRLSDSTPWHIHAYINLTDRSMSRTSGSSRSQSTPLSFRMTRLAGVERSASSFQSGSVSPDLSSSSSPSGFTALDGVWSTAANVPLLVSASAAADTHRKRTPGSRSCGSLGRTYEFVSTLPVLVVPSPDWYPSPSTSPLTIRAGTYL
jgi:hypothetical protein